MMTPEQVEEQFKHVATKEDLALLQTEIKQGVAEVRTELHKEILINTRWLIGTMIILQIPTWVAMLQIWNFLATIASKLPR